MSKNAKILIVETVAAALLAALVLPLLPTGKADAAPNLPSSRFQEKTVISGLNYPTAVEFAKNGKVFVAEKSGIIKVFDSLSDKTPTRFADLRPKVHDYLDRGLPGLALHPNFPRNPYVYALYSHDAPIGGRAPRYNDACPPGASGPSCVASGRLSRLTANGNRMSSEKVLIEDWCTESATHSIGALTFGKDGALYVSGGDGAYFRGADYGQQGDPPNACGDPPVGVGGTQTPPRAEGGALRSQDLRTPADPVTLDGAILRVNPTTGKALPTNPLYSRADPNARRIIAYGLRNPFRFAIRPGTNEVWVGDVGQTTWEEINRIPNPTDRSVENFGWPCYEGKGRQPQYDRVNLNICERLYGAAGAAKAPHYAYKHKVPSAGDRCVSTQGSISGLAFYPKGGRYPDKYDGALFFADYSRNCIWVMRKGSNGLPSPAKVGVFATGAATPVELQIGPKGDLFYVDIIGGMIRRIEYFEGNRPPVAQATPRLSYGTLPLTVNFDGTKSRDPDGDRLRYAWDLDGDGAYDDSNKAKPTYTYRTAKNFKVGLKVLDGRGKADTLDQKLLVSAGNTPPKATITSPPEGTRWIAGQTISFSGEATDQQDGELGGSRLSWSLTVRHCPFSSNSCHTHPSQEEQGSSGSFVAPDAHGSPSYLELRLTATDSRGLRSTDSVRLDP